MSTQLGLSPTSTLQDVRAALQQAITQEEAAISSSQQRLQHYHQQLTLLSELADTGNGLNGAVSEAAPVAAPPVAQSSNGTATAERSTRSTRRTKGTGRTAAADSKKAKPATTTTGEVTSKRKSRSATAVEPAEPSAAPATASTDGVADEAGGVHPLLRPLKQFQGKPLADVIVQVLEKQGKPLNAQDLARIIYGATQMQDTRLRRRAHRIVSSNLVLFLPARRWQKVSEAPWPKYALST